MRRGHAQHLRRRSKSGHRPLDHRRGLSLLPELRCRPAGPGHPHNFSAWSAHVDSGLNAALEAFHPGGNIGDRDTCPSPEAPSTSTRSSSPRATSAPGARSYLDWTTGQAAQLAIHTHRGSSAFANPTFTGLLSPSGRPALLVTLFVPVQGAALNEGGGARLLPRALDPGTSGASDSAKNGHV